MRKVCISYLPFYITKTSKLVEDMDKDEEIPVPANLVPPLSPNPSSPAMFYTLWKILDFFFVCEMPAAMILYMIRHKKNISLDRINMMIHRPDTQKTTRFYDMAKIILTTPRVDQFEPWSRTFVTGGHLDALRVLHRNFPSRKIKVMSQSQAASMGRLDMLRMLETRYTPSYVNQNIVFDAAAGGHLAVTKYLFEKTKDLPLNKLYMAFSWEGILNKGNVEVLDFLFHNVKHEIHFQSWNFMCDAVDSGHLPMVKYLASKQVPWNDGMKDAAISGHLDIVKFMWTRGVQVSHKAIAGAVRAKQWKVVEFAIDHDFPCNCQRTLVNHLVAAEQVGLVKKAFVKEYKVASDIWTNVQSATMIDTLLQHGVPKDPRLPTFLCWQNKPELLEHILKLGWPVLENLKEKATSKTPECLAILEKYNHV